MSQKLGSPLAAQVFDLIKTRLIYAQIDARSGKKITKKGARRGGEGKREFSMGMRRPKPASRIARRMRPPERASH
jgi:hypothetical protein